MHFCLRVLVSFSILGSMAASVLVQLHWAGVVRIVRLARPPKTQGVKAAVKARSMVSESSS